MEHVLKRWRLAAAFLPPLVALAGASSPVPGQISPGPLSSAHSSIGGNADCLECHQAKAGVAADLCLSCHELLAERIRNDAGLHARPDYAECHTCHIEHQGAEFELVWWGEAGIDSFDHTLTGYTLEGGHSRAACRDCHRASSIRVPRALLQAEKNLDRTFLGLEQSCASCHRDIHAGEFETRACSGCHDFETWKPARGFDHGETRFPLTGAHRSAECDKCHRNEAPTRPGDSEPALDFRIASFSSCGACHQDPHEGRLGARCETCHATSTWRDVPDTLFDHDRTRFPLIGRHREVACSKCHPAQSHRVARFGLCSDCHFDIHAGQFAVQDTGRTACDSCHGQDRFSPSSFTVARHQDTDYPLEGAHLAIACDECHRPVAPELIREVVENKSGSRRLPEVSQFRFASKECTGCHRDPHEGKVGERGAAEGCRTCHSLSGWRSIDFDHRTTRFTLEGKHRDVACRPCHAGSDPEPRATGDIRFAGASTECGSCHRDPHQGQFASAQAPARCETCHSDQGWATPLLFDHDLDSRYRLEGAHRRVACAACHLQETAAGQTFTRYRPLASECKDCHG